MPDTTTESELAEAGKVFAGSREPTLAGSLRDALGRIGITVVPDPIPEPEGDVIVVDGAGRRWAKDHGPQMWTTSTRDSVLVRDWRNLTKRGPVKIYRLEES